MKKFTRYSKRVYKLHRKKVLNLRDHPFVLPVLTFLALFFISSVALIAMNARTVGAEDTRIVQLTINGEQQTVPTRAATVGDLLERLAIPVSTNDIVEPALDTPIDDDSFRINVYHARPVAVIDDLGAKLTVLSAHQEPRTIAQKAGVTLYPEDKVERSRAEVIDPAEILREGVVAEKVVIERATPVIINLYGTQIPVRTHADTVAEVLKEKNIKLLEGDVMNVAADVQLTANASVVIVRMGRQIETREETLAMVSETLKDPNLAIGKKEIRQAGKPGKKVVTYEIELQNNREVARRILQEVVVEEPLKQITAIGTKAPTVAIAGDKSALLSAAGVPASQHAPADYIISKESGWRLNARNASGCLGLGQACPGSKLINACPAWETDAICQIQFFTRYVNGRYGSWQGAYNFWIVNRWY